jgi:hypothetical protein
VRDLPTARVVRVGETDAANAGTGAPSAPVLRLAPRALPGRLIVRIWFGTPLAWVGWLFAAIGMVACMVFLPVSELWSPDYDRTTVATITGLEETNSSENDRRIYRARYTFVDERGVTRTGASYTTDPSLAGEHPVEYVAGDPGASRLAGMRSRPFSAWVAFVLLFPLVGLAIAIHQLVAGRRATCLLRRGVETRGRLVGKRTTNIQINNQPVMALTFEYEAGGRTYRAEVRTLTPSLLEDDAEEAMVYDPYHPARATTLDHLPGAPRVTADGEIAARPGIAVHFLLLPAVTVLLLAATIGLITGR